MRPLIMILVLLLASPALAATTRCLTYEEKALGRLQTLCDDGTRAVSTYNKTMECWETTITSPPGEACIEALNPKMHQCEGRCR